MDAIHKRVMNGILTQFSSSARALEHGNSKAIYLECALHSSRLPAGKLQTEGGAGLHLDRGTPSAFNIQFLTINIPRTRYLH